MALGYQALAVVGVLLVACCSVFYYRRTSAATQSGRGGAGKDFQEHNNFPVELDNNPISRVNSFPAAWSQELPNDVAVHDEQDFDKYVQRQSLGVEDNGIELN